MNLACSAICRWCWLLLVTLLATGCTGPLAKLPGNPFARDTQADRVRYGRTPSEKVEELRELADEAADLPAEEQELIAQALSHQLNQEPDPRMRMELTRTLGALPTSTSLSAALSSLNDPKVDVRLAACDALAQLGDPSAIPALSRALSQDDNVDVQLAATRALGNFRRPEAVAALGEAIEGRDPALRNRGIASLRMASEVDLGTDVAAWQNHVSGVIASLERETTHMAEGPGASSVPLDTATNWPVQPGQRTE